MDQYLELRQVGLQHLAKTLQVGLQRRSRLLANATDERLEALFNFNMRLGLALSLNLFLRKQFFIIFRNKIVNFENFKLSTNLIVN